MKVKKINPIVAILVLVAVLQFAVICYFNLTQLQQHIGYDTSTYYYTAIEMWEQKSLILSEWEYQTTLNIDSTAPLAAVLYGITGDIFNAYGMANIIITVIFILVLNAFLKKFPISTMSRVIGINLSLVLHFALHYNNANSLYYGDVLFIQNAAYNVKTILALWLLIIAMDLNEGKKNIPSIIGGVIMCGVSGFSSGYWILATVVLPLFLLQLTKMILDQDWKGWWKSRLNCFILASIAASLVGKMAVGVFLNYESKESLMTLISIEKFWKNLGSIWQGYLDLLTALPQDSGIEALTFDGVCFGINFLFAALIVIGALYSFRKKEYEKDYKEQVVLSVIVVDLLIFIFMDTTYGSRFFEVRYLILLFLVGLQYFGKIFDLISTRINIHFLGLCTAAMLILINISSNMPYYKEKNNYDTLMTIVHSLEKYDTSIIYTYGDELIIDSRNLRVLDLSKIYKHIGPDKKVLHWGDTTKRDDLAHNYENIIVITEKNELENLEAIVNQELEVLETVEEYIFVCIKENPFDLVSGFGNGEDLNIDTVWSPGMKMDDHGKNKKDNIIENTKDEGRYVLYGPYADVSEGCYNITLKYELHGDTETSFFDVAVDSGREVLGSQVLSQGVNEAKIENISITDPNDEIEYRVYLNGKEKVTIYSIIIEKVK